MDNLIKAQKKLENEKISLECKRESIWKTIESINIKELKATEYNRLTKQNGLLDGFLIFVLFETILGMKPDFFVSSILISGLLSASYFTVYNVHRVIRKRALKKQYHDIDEYDFEKSFDIRKKYIEECFIIDKLTAEINESLKKVQEKIDNVEYNEVLMEPIPEKKLVKRLERK